MRIILYTGKGGVGKTSVAAATACKIAKEGKKVLIMSTDQAHSLADAFEIKLSEEPKEIERNLYAMEVDVVVESEKAWGNMKVYLKQLLTAKAEGGIETEELLVFPGFEELFSLLKIKEIYDAAEYDVLLVDCAPTGETMALLKFPEMIGSWIGKVLPIKRKAVKVAGPAIEKITSVPMPKDALFSEIEELMNKLEALQTLMNNKEVVSIRIVTTPEKIVIQEAKRNFDYLHLYDYMVDAIIVNRIYPKEAMDGYFEKWIKRQEESLQDIKNSFQGIRVFYLTLQKKELKSVPVLLDAAEQIYGKTDPIPLLGTDKTVTFEKNESGYLMKVYIPFADKKELQLEQHGSQLHLAIKNEKRIFELPKELHTMEINEAKFDSEALEVSFIDCK